MLLNKKPDKPYTHTLPGIHPHDTNRTMCNHNMMATTTSTSSLMTATRPHRILLTNDDGISAPGLRALVAALARDGFETYVCAPSGERSAQSSAITLQRYVEVYSASSALPGAVAAYAVAGTPADSAMLALNSPLFKGVHFDLVVSGINRGDNCGLHVIYSGTVGAAREGTTKGLAAIALSLDDHRARREDDYATAAELATHVMRATLEVLAAGGVLSSSSPSSPSTSPPSAEAAAAADALAGGVILNVNIPPGAAADMKGFALTHQGVGCVFPRFIEVASPSEPTAARRRYDNGDGGDDTAAARDASGADAAGPSPRVFKNYAGDSRRDGNPGSDGWAVAHRWVSVTPLGLRSDLALAPQVPVSAKAAPQQHGAAAAGVAVAAVAAVVAAAAAAARMPTRGLERALPQTGDGVSNATSGGGGDLSRATSDDDLVMLVD